MEFHLMARAARAARPLARLTLLDEAVFVGVAPGSCSRCRAAGISGSPALPCPSAPIGY